MSGRHHAHLPPRPGLARVWTGVAVVCASLGLWLLLPARQDGGVLTLALAPAVEPVTAQSVDALPPSPPVGVSIPALDVKSRVMRLGLEDDGSLEVPPGAYPAGWYERGPTPGEPGAAVLVGHIDWANEDGVFHDIGSLRPGDTVAVDRADGTTATFAVERVTRVPKDEFPTDQVYGHTAAPELRLITCGGEFDEDSGEYVDNIVVFARFLPPS